MKNSIEVGSVIKASDTNHHDISDKDMVKNPYVDSSPSTSIKEDNLKHNGELEQGDVSAESSLQTALQYVTKTLDSSDDPTIKFYTFRAFFLGSGLSCFGAVIAEIFYFKPQTVGVSTIFLAIIAYFLGTVMSFIPRWGKLGRFLNPHDFTLKEHIFVTIMASSAATCALGTEQLAVQSLYYNETPNGASAIFMLLSSQMLGYGMIGAMRKLYVYPTKFVWPGSLPLASLFQSIHLDKAISKKRVKVFWWVCGAVMIWELIPQYIFPLTVGVSVFCLVNQHSAVFTYLFGGANGNEGLGFLSWCMDWQYVGTSQIVVPINTLFNEFIGYIGCIILTTAIYWGNLWNAKSFRFMAQGLFLANGSQYDQLQILGDDNKVDKDRLAAYGVPWFSTSNAMSLLVMNIAVTAVIVHIFLWNWDDIKPIFTWAKPAALKVTIRRLCSKDMLRFWKKDGSYVEVFPGTENDPHFAAIQNYKEAPGWWYGAVFFIALAIGLVCTYQQKTDLPWWTFLLACLLSFILLIFYAPLYALTGSYFQPVTAVQMIGSYLRPGYPAANMMFTLYGSNSMSQGIGMLSDLKFAQYAKLPPRAVFVAQMLGTAIGAVLNWVMMNSIVKNQRTILLSVEGTNVWSGQNVQSYNAQAIAWGGVGPEMFNIHGTYHMVPIGLAIGIFVPIPFYLTHRYWPKLRMNEINTSIIANWLGVLSVGINSSLLPKFCIGFFAQGYLRKYRAVLFAKYAIIFAAAISGGVELIVFILTFAVFGGSGESRPFPAWWGNNGHGNVDRCKYMN